MRDKPGCTKCGRYHWGFQPCAKGRTPDRIQRIPEGFHTWGDQTVTLVHRGNNVFDLPNRKFKPTGTVTLPPAA